MRPCLAAIGAVFLTAGIVYRLSPRRLQLSPPAPPAAVVDFTAATPAVTMPGFTLVADVAAFDDELFAYLMFGHLRDLVGRDGIRAWLTYERREKSLWYVVRLELPGDLLAGLPYLFRLRASGVISRDSWAWVAPQTAARYEAQSRIFDTAYSLPARKPLEILPRPELAAYLRRFIRFKATTDGRIRAKIEPVPSLPSRPEAHRIAEDILAVADFFELPVDFFLGIGAMENNYMEARGDLGNAVWKRRAAKGDMVLRRGAKGVLVLNESSGMWQITRETLRYAHRRYLRDRRDYSSLPEHLRPPKELDLDAPPPEVLTTYAGLFFRDLLDRFNGDVATAVGAYNGGPGRPNPQYEAGVRTVAESARKILEQAAILRGRPAAEMRFLSASR